MLALHNLVRDFEGNTNEMSIDMNNFRNDLEVLDAEKDVEFPGRKIRYHLEDWEKDCPGTTNEEIKEFAG